MSGYEVNQRAFNKFFQFHKAKIAKKVEELYPEVIFNAIKEDSLLPQEDMISFLKKETNLDENTIIDGLNELIAQKRIASAKDNRNRVFIHKKTKF